MNWLTVNDDAVKIFAESGDPAADVYQLEEARVILEDVESPLTTKFIEKLYTQIIDKKHVNFDNIPESRGNIKEYSGYTSMMDTLENLKTLATTNKKKDVLEYVTVIRTSIERISLLSEYYMNAFQVQNDMIMIEYNALVFCCVEATTSILSQFVEIVKGFKTDMYAITFKNTLYKANKFYFDQLAKFNRAFKTGRYREYLDTAISNGDSKQFIGSTAVGVVTVAVSVMLIIIPAIRMLIYQVYNLRSKLSDALSLQATFLEMNRSCIEANSAFNQTKRDKILKKQEHVKIIFEKLSDRLRVDNVVASRKSEESLKKENSKLSKDFIRDEVDSTPLNFLM